MATRRTTTSRLAQPSGSSMPGSRSRPTASSSRVSSSRPQAPTAVEAETDAAAMPPPTKRPKHGHEDNETNIKVVIRCRRRSEREVDENSPIIVTSSGAKSNEVTIETSSPPSTLGVVSLPPTRTYPFDIVFGPEADQALVYHEVVAPMLQEVIQGYNCTLFAYGQTGTGKTHTMQGDLIPTALGNPSAQAGMIPRALFRLFNELEKSTADYVVKVSYIELYNEELRDLLAPELAAPTGTMQPMGKDSNRSEGLKIFDDASKKGVVIQGLEEFSVSNSADALSLLEKGSQRRQIAATKFNDHSSRSHSIFTLTVHTKEKSSIGEDLLRVGKMNLVDLAGSENIGRSGAANQRAREAGMINQSLLTLGRVINALVDRSSHVPYRESKLTRLLQDSLGGRTKTCIVATVSPSRSNMEETLSTLDYALRAKSIKNKPELNQRMTRNALLKDYVAEIERLKADVHAAREKDGIFVTEARWTAMENEIEMAKTEREEARREIDVIKSRERNALEELDQCMAVLRRSKAENADLQAGLASTKEELGNTRSTLRRVEGALEEENVVRQAYQDNEPSLDAVASGLKEVAVAGLGDLGGVFDKLDRKATVLTSNSKSIFSHGKALTTNGQALTMQLNDFLKTATQHAQRLKVEAEQFQKKEIDGLATLSDRASEQARKVQEALQLIQSKETVADDAMRSIQGVFDSAFSSMESGIATWSEGLQKSVSTICADLQASSASAFNEAEKVVKTVSSSFDAIVREAQMFVESERKLALGVKTATEEAVSSELARLRSQNALLTSLLDGERLKLERARDELLQRVAGLFGDFTAERERGMRDAFGKLERSNQAAEPDLTTFGEEQRARVDEAVGKGKQWSANLERQSSELKRTRDAALKALTSSSATLQDGSDNLQLHVTTSTIAYTSELSAEAQSLSASYAGATNVLGRAKRARTEAVTQMANDAQASFRYLQQGVASTSKSVTTSVGRIAAESAAQFTSTESYHAAASTHLVNIRQATQSLLEDGTREDIPTGTTPRKRKWDYVNQWELTQPRDVVLREWRQRGSKSARTVVERHLMPENESEELLDEEEEEEQLHDEEDEENDVLEALQEERHLTNEVPVESRSEIPDPPPAYEPPPPTKATEARPPHSRSASSLSGTSEVPAVKAAPRTRRPSLLAKPVTRRTTKESSLPVPPALSDRPSNVHGTRRRIVR